jgi:hypothetical protein
MTINMYLHINPYPTRVQAYVNETKMLNKTINDESCVCMHVCACACVCITNSNLLKKFKAHTKPCGGTQVVQ